MKGVGNPHYNHTGICTAYGDCIRAAVRPDPFCAVHGARLNPETRKALRQLFSEESHRLSRPQGPAFEARLEAARLEVQP